MTHTLRTTSGGRALAEIMAAALGAAEPAAAVRKALRRDGDTLIIGEQLYDLNQVNRIFVVGAGKAGAPMAAAAAEVQASNVLTDAPAKVIVDKWSVDQAIEWEDKKIKEIYDTIG